MDKEDTVNMLRSLLISKKETYELGELLKDFKNETGYSLPLFGYKTPLDFLKSIPDSLQLVGSYQKIMVIPINNRKTAHIASLIKRQNSAKTRHRIRSNLNSEISCDKIIHNTKQESSIGSMNAKKSDNVKCIAINNNNDNFSSDKYKSVKSDYEVDNKESKINDYRGKYSDSDDFSETKAQRVEMSNFDSNLIMDLCEIPKLNLESFAKIGAYVEVCVSVIWNPHNFTLQLRKFKIKLRNLMLEMQLFYNQNGVKYKIPDSGLKCSNLCAVLCKTNRECSKWYRGVILEIGDRNSVVVGLIDYGRVMKVEITNIRSLHRRFGNLPPQALSGHLANIRPCAGDAWSQESNERFLNLVYERELVAGIVDLDYEEMWLSVALSFTDGVDVHISDTLVEENLAAFDSCVSGLRVCLPWIGCKGGNPLCHSVPEFWFHPKEFGQYRNSGSDKEECYKSNPNTLFYSYSQSNARLHEMFLTN